MYEQLMGLGWSDIENFPTCSQVPGGGFKKCFLTTQADERCAEYSQCFRLSENCRTIDGGTGRAWCCPHDRPPPFGPCIPSGVDPNQPAPMVCRQQEVPYNSLRDSRRRAVWRVQNKLCQLGLDPGPVDGHGTNDMYRIAIRAFQSRNGLPVTGEVDSVTLNRMGFSSTESAAIDSALQGGPLQPGMGLGGNVSYLWVFAFLSAASFLGFSYWKWGRR